MLDQTSQQPHLAALPPVSSVCAESPSLQRYWTLLCPTPPAKRSPLCRLQSQIRSLPIRRRCLPDIGRQRRLFFVPFAAFGLLQRHGMDKPAFKQLQAQLVKRPPVESLRATGGCTLEIHRQVLKGRLRGQRADASTGHADGVPLFQIPLLFVGKLLKCRRNRLCLNPVPEDFGIVPATVTPFSAPTARLIVPYDC